MALTDNLLGYWKLDETSGTTATDSHASLNLTTTGATVNVTGKITKAYSFDGTGDYTEKTSGVGGFTSGGSINLWVNLDVNSDAGYGGVAGFQTSAGDRFWICYRADTANDGFWARVFDGATYYDAIQKDGSPVSSGSWNMVTLVYDMDANTLKIYVNATLKATATSVGDIDSNSGKFTIGRDTTGAFNETEADIDEVGLWSRALTGTEITELYNSGSGLAYPFATNYTATPSALDIALGMPTPAISLDLGLSTLNISVDLYAPLVDRTLPPTGSIEVGSGGYSSRWLKKKYPFTPGLIAGTTKLHGRRTKLKPTEGSKVYLKDRVLID